MNVAKQVSVEDIIPEFHSIGKTDAVFQSSSVTYNDSSVTYNSTTTFYGGSDTFSDDATILERVQEEKPKVQAIIHL